MPILALLEIGIQVFFAVHALKTGRPYYWLFIIFIFPLLGSLVYFFVEYYPDMQETGRIRRMRGPSGSVRPGLGQIRHLEDQVEISPSLKNKQNLAEAYAAAGQFDQAIAVYRDCLQGAYKNDLPLLEGLARTYFQKGDFQEARQTLQTVRELRGDRKDDQIELMYVRTLEELGFRDEAREAYAGLYQTYSGEEARCRYALLLKDMGDRDTADRLFHEIINNVRLAPEYYQKAQRGWVDLARKNMTA